jgi:hypothetical protein
VIAFACAVSIKRSVHFAQHRHASFAAATRVARERVRHRNIEKQAPIRNPHDFEEELTRRVSRNATPEREIAEL